MLFGFGRFNQRNNSSDSSDSSDDGGGRFVENIPYREPPLHRFLLVGDDNNRRTNPRFVGNIQSNLFRRNH